MDERCRWCAQPAERCDGACHGPGDPPRFCPACGRRLTTFATPGTLVLRCRDHGEVSGG